MTRTEIEAKHIDWRTIIKAADDTPADVVAALDAYFEPFAQPVHKDGPGEEMPMLCIKCGEPLTGLLASMFGRGGFEWGIVHGEGHCAGCHWPARAHHFIKDAAGQDVTSIHNYVLQYHPDFVSERSADERTAEEA